MCRVTNYFSIRNGEKESRTGTAAQIYEDVLRKSDKAKASKLEAGWPTLKQALVPDPCAMSTYVKVVEWITHADVDALSKATAGKPNFSTRESIGPQTGWITDACSKELGDLCHEVHVFLKQLHLIA